MNRFTKYFCLTGIALVAMSVFIVIKIFYPIIKEEIKYQVFKNAESFSFEKSNKNEEKIIIPTDQDFGIIIPKINANVGIIPEIDSQDSAVYQSALTKGVAHAKGTAYPGENNNIFIFAHSGADILEANKYNAVFYLLLKLENGDDIFIFYNRQKYHYIVNERKTVNANEIQYIGETPEEQLTLMTCWPPGTTMKRLIIFAEPVR